jgi:putative salt-induced outer membrane protein YdiY
MNRVVLLPILFAALAAAAAADVISLSNGDRITGAVVKADARALTLKTKAMGDVTIAMAEIVAIQSDQPLYLALTDGQTVAGTVATSGASLQVATRETGSVTVNRTAVATIRCEAEQAAHLAETERYHNPDLLDLWSGFVDVGLSLASGNADTLTFATGANAVRETRRDKTSLYFQSLYGRAEVNGVSETNANAVRGGARYDIFLSDRFSVFGITDLEYDEFQQLDLRLVLGGGAGYYLIKSDVTQLQLFGGGNLNKEYFFLDSDRTTGEFMAGQDFATRLAGRFGFKERFVVFPNLSEGGEYRFVFDAAVVTTLNKWLDWHLTLSDRYNSLPATGAESNDVLLTTGLRLNFKR